MPLFKLSAGSMIDVLNKQELRELMQEWKADHARGARPVRISADFKADATGLAVGGGASTLTGGTLGPAPGFWWSVQRLAVRVDSTPAAYEVYQDRRSAQSLIRDVDGSNNGYVSFGNNEVMLDGTSSLVIAASSLTPGSIVYVSGMAIEIPMTLLWKWLAG